MHFSTTRTTLAAILLSSGFLTIPGIWSHPPAPAPQGPNNPVFARKITGTWVLVGNNLGSTLQIEADGTLTWFGTWFFGNGADARYNGPVYGTWKQVGQNKIETIEVGYLFDGNNAWNVTGRVKEEIVFSPDLKSFTFSGTEDLIAKNQDPTDPNAPVVFSFTFSGGPYRRLSR